MPNTNREKRRIYDNEWKREKRHGLKGDEIRTYQRNYIKKWRKQHPEKDKKYAEKTRWERKKYHANYFQKNKVKFRKQKQEYYIKHKEYFKQKSRENYLKWKEQKKTEWQIERKKALAGYGSKCACCSETTTEFLALDHVNNDGKQHRMLVKIKMYRWVIQNNFPVTIQILCHNCNNAKAFYGKCPHEND